MFLAPIFSSTGVDTGDIGHSLRLRSSSYANKTLSTPTNSLIWTAHFAIKRGTQGTSVNTSLLTAGQLNTYPDFSGIDITQDVLALTHDVNGTIAWQATCTGVFRDVEHFWLTVDYNSTLATAADRVKFYVNGVQRTSSGTFPAQNAACYLNTARQHLIGAIHGGAAITVRADYYISRVCFVDGQALTPDSFGYFNTEINEWVSKSQAQVKAVVDASGANSFMLDFDDGSSTTTLGYDKSSKGNNWTLNNISLTAGTTYDWMLDVPGNSYATLNPLVPGYSNAGKSNGNLTGSNSSAGGATYYTTMVAPSGKFYFEFTATTVTGNFFSVFAAGLGYYSNGTKDGSAAFGATYTSGDVIGVAFDIDAGTTVFYKNNILQGTQSGGSTGAVSCGATNSGDTFNINFGQRPFAYTPPTGYKALCQANLPEPAIKNPERHMDVVLATGANIKATAEALFPSNFFEWIKDRANYNNHQLIDIVRGTSAVLQSNTKTAETVYSTPAGSSVGWVWKAGGAPVVNNAGSIPSQVSANVLAGFSIVTYTGTGANATVGHGLGKAPGLIIYKNRVSAAGDWVVGHSAVPWTDYLILTTTAARATAVGAWANTAPNSAAFAVGSLCVNSEAFVAYCFAEIEGFSKIGSYTGNGSTDGPYVDCGFKPKFMIVKCSSGVADWSLFDATRDPDNVVDSFLFPNLSLAEQLSGQLDFTSTGFKLRGTVANVNQNGAAYIFIAFADVPAKYSLGR